MTTADSSRRAVLGAGAAFAAAAWSDLGPGALAQATPSDNPFKTSGAAPKVEIPVHTRKMLTVETVTPENFAPFGVVLTEQGRTRLPINTYGDKLDLYREGFQSDQPIEWFIVNGRPRWNGVLFLERHLQLTQTFIPLGGKPFYTVMAPADAPDVNGFVPIDHLRAFYVPGDVAIQVHRGTWHENPMPKVADTRLLVTSHARLTVAHQQSPDPAVQALAVDLERRWYRHGGYELTLAV